MITQKEEYTKEKDLKLSVNDMKKNEVRVVLFKPEKLIFDLHQMTIARDKFIEELQQNSFDIFDTKLHGGMLDGKECWHYMIFVRKL